jgi:YVTN family beta-propeller protein
MNGRVYVTNDDSNIVAIVNGMGETGSIKANGTPYGIAYDNRNGYLYVTIGGFDGDVAVINGSSDVVVETIPVGMWPDAIAYDNENGYLYVVNNDYYGKVTVINGTSNAVVGLVPVGGWPNSIAIDSGNGNLYVTGQNNSDYYYNGSVTVIDGRNNSVIGNLPVAQPGSVAYDNASGYLYIPSGNHGNITLVDGYGVIVGTIPGLYPGAITYDYLNHDMYILREGTFPWGEVTVVNGTTNMIERSVTVGSEPYAITVDEINGYVYVANMNSDNLSVIDGSTSESVGSVQVGPVLGDCLSNVTYSWALTSDLGTLSASSGPSVVFTAGTIPGNITLFVNATWNGTTTLGGASIVIVMPPPALFSVIVFPGSATVSPGKQISFTAAPICKGGACPSGVTYSWSLTNLLGTVNSTTADPVTITAGSANGTITLFVNATLNGVTKQSAPVNITITIASPRTSGTVGPSTGILGLPGVQGYFVLGIGAAAGVVVVAVWFRALLPPPKQKGLSRPPPGPDEFM